MKAIGTAMRRLMADQKVGLTDPVVVVGIRSNGSTEHAGIVTRVWADKNSGEAQAIVNVMAFPDAASPLSMETLKYFASLRHANIAEARLPFCYKRT